MSTLILLQITSLMYFLYSIKIKMYKNNFIGFLTILTTLLTVALSVIENNNFNSVHYLLTTLLLIFIVIYHTYKSFKRINKC